MGKYESSSHGWSGKKPLVWVSEYYVTIMGVRVLFVGVRVLRGYYFKYI